MAKTVPTDSMAISFLKTFGKIILRLGILALMILPIFLPQLFWVNAILASAFFCAAVLSKTKWLGNSSGEVNQARTIFYIIQGTTLIIPFCYPAYIALNWFSVVAYSLVELLTSRMRVGLFSSAQRNPMPEKTNHSEIQLEKRMAPILEPNEEFVKSKEKDHAQQAAAYVSLIASPPLMPPQTRFQELSHRIESLCSRWIMFARKLELEQLDSEIQTLYSSIITFIRKTHYTLFSIYGLSGTLHTFKIGEEFQLNRDHWLGKLKKVLGHPTLKITYPDVQTLEGVLDELCILVNEYNMKCKDPEYRKQVLLHERQKADEIQADLDGHLERMKLEGFIGGTAEAFKGRM